MRSESEGSTLREHLGLPSPTNRYAAVLVLLETGILLDGVGMPMPGAVLWWQTWHEDMNAVVKAGGAQARRAFLVA